MNLVPTAELMPGACYITGRNDGPFVDTGYDIDDLPNVGRVYISASFISDCLALIGGLGPEGAEELRRQIAVLQAHVDTLEGAVGGLTDANKALFAGGYRINDGPWTEFGTPETAAEPAEEPVTAEQIAAAFVDNTDDELLEFAVDAGITLPADATRDDFIRALADLALSRRA